MSDTDKGWYELITHEDEKRFKHVEEMARISFVPCFECLRENLDHRG